jgi:hypothetical protein
MPRLRSNDCDELWGFAQTLFDKESIEANALENARTHEKHLLVTKIKTCIQNICREFAKSSRQEQGQIREKRISKKPTTKRFVLFFFFSLMLY